MASTTDKVRHVDTVTYSTTPDALTDPKVNNRDLTDDEIERAIAEIQTTIKRYGGN